MTEHAREPATIPLCAPSCPLFSPLCLLLGSALLCCCSSAGLASALFEFASGWLGQSGRGQRGEHTTRRAGKSGTETGRAAASLLVARALASPACLRWRSAAAFLSVFEF
jgi:hypothetical protein